MLPIENFLTLMSRKVTDLPSFPAHATIFLVKDRAFIARPGRIYDVYETLHPPAAAGLLSSSLVEKAYKVSAAVSWIRQAQMLERDKTLTESTEITEC